jgi:hypothetical protein
MHECEASAQSQLKDMWRSVLEKDLLLAEPLTADDTTRVGDTVKGLLPEEPDFSCSSKHPRRVILPASA